MRSAFKMNNFFRQNILQKIDSLKSDIDSHRPFCFIDLTQNKRTEVYWSACELSRIVLERQGVCKGGLYI